MKHAVFEKRRARRGLSLLAALLAFTLTLALPQPAFAASYRDLALALIDAAGAGEGLLRAKASAAGTTAGDWYAVAVGSLGTEDPAPYANALAGAVRARYASEGGLSATKATEYHRVALALAALGYDPAAVPLENGETADLLTDGVFAFPNVGRQGVNGQIFALLTLSAFGLTDPRPEANTDAPRLTAALLEKRTPDGGWSLAGQTADPDVTAMAITALCMAGQDPAWETIAAAFEVLSSARTPSGAFAGREGETCETAAWVVLALLAAGRDPDNDPAFTVDGVSAVDAFLAFRRSDGSFRHTLTDDAHDAAITNAEALLALTALTKRAAGEPFLFDFTGKALRPLDPASVTDPEPEPDPEPVTDPATRKIIVSGVAVAVVLIGAAALYIRRRKRRE